MDNNTTLISVNLDVTCRTCLSESDKMLCIYTNSLQNMILECTRIQVSEDDGLPSQICYRCHMFIIKFLQFQRRTQSSDKFLRSFIDIANKHHTENRNNKPYGICSMEVNLDQCVSAQDIIRKEEYHNISNDTEVSSEYVDLSQLDSYTDYEFLEPNDSLSDNACDDIFVDEKTNETCHMDANSLHLEGESCEVSLHEEQSVEKMSVEQNDDTTFSVQCADDVTSTSPVDDEDDIDGDENRFLYVEGDDDSELIDLFDSANSDCELTVKHCYVSPGGTVVVNDDPLGFALSPGVDGRVRVDNESACMDDEPEHGGSPVQYSSASQTRVTSVSVVAVPTGKQVQDEEVYEIFLPGSNISEGHFLRVNESKTLYGAKPRSYTYYRRVLNDRILINAPDQPKVKTEQLECRECGDRFVHPQKLHSHMVLHEMFTNKHETELEPDVCFDCNGATYTLDCEKAQHQAMRPLIINKMDNRCPVEGCLKVMSSRAACFHHVTTQHSDLGSLKYDGWPPDQSVTRRGVFPCKFCGKRFVSRSQIVMHIRTHTGEKPFLCADCGKCFATMGGMDLHQRRHTGERPYQCPHCKRGFAETSNLKVHIRSHTGEKPFICKMCQRRFSRFFLLQLHMRTHTGEKPYSCLYCEKSFKQKGDLNSHRRIHTNDRPHKCPLCPKTFIKSSALSLHLKGHDKNNVKD